ncbi:MG2 domain-containing protein [Hymenobacter coccineus]|nr:MG2 domain-containing protein [Hymenobacter coccineus]
MARQAEAARDSTPVAAVALARAAEARYPKSRGAARARALRAEIERPELTFSAAEIVVPGQPWRLDATVRNITELHAWAYRITLAQWYSFKQYDGRLMAERYAKVLRAAPAVSWAVPVPAHPVEYKEQKLATAGAALPIGYYLVVIGNKASEPTKQQPGDVAAYAVVGASELSALIRRDPDTGAQRLLLLNRQSGQLLPRISTQATYQHIADLQPTDKFSRTVYLKGQLLQTDANGEVPLPIADKVDSKENVFTLGKERLVKMWRGRDTLLLHDDNNYYQAEQPKTEKPQRRTFLFTDRAIYRPGQTVYFKGILMENQGGKSRLLTKEKQDVELEDVNGDTVQKLSFVTNDFGSFSGSFVLPAGLLNGEFKLSADDGELAFAVEDYKRPTFYVQLDSVPGRPQLGQPLAVAGRARAYAGQATDGATVQYRVTRRALWALLDYDYWGGVGGRAYRPGSPGTGTTEIAHGTATTNADGRFSITFTPPLVLAKPGRFGWQPGFLFEVAADVTDAAGETRSATRGFPIGRNPLSLRLVGPEMADKQRLPTFRLLGTNATGEPLPAAGTLRLLAIRYRPNPAGVPGPVPETAANEAKPELVKTLAFDTKTSAALDLNAALGALPTGRYRLEAQAAGRDSARAQQDFTLYDSGAPTVPFATPDWFVALADTVAPGQSAAILLGSSEADARILLEVERGGQLLRQEWLTLRAGEQRRVAVASGPASAPGPLYIHTTQVRANRLYRHDATVQVAAKPQPLQLTISTFRDKLQPGQKETWRIAIHQAGGQAADAELLATLYDQSLDVFRQHSFGGLAFDNQYYQPRYGWQGSFDEANWVATTSAESAGETAVEYPMLNTWETLADRSAPGNGIHIRIRGVSSLARSAPAPASPMMSNAMAADKASLNEVVVTGLGGGNQGGSDSNSAAGVTSQQRSVNLSAVPTRTDFRETALWEPALRTDKNGDVVLEFQMPEAVTRWQLLALAHDRNLRTGQLARQLVTQKEIQLTPNAPRFLRQGDTFTFPAKFSNLTDHATRGTAQLFLLDAATGQDLTAQLLRGPAQQPVAAGAHQSAALGWEINLPADFASVAVTYRVVAETQSTVDSEQLTGKKSKKKNRQAPLSAGEGPPQRGPVRFSDGEENTLPVLPNRILVTESLPLPVVGPGTRTFELKKLTSTASPTRRNYSLTLEMTANPAWYAVQSLPYLMEYPYECSEQVFDRLYANLLAAQILKSTPRFRTVLAEWTRQSQSGTAAQRNQLASKLNQNQELKNLLLQETPWVRDAQGETERLARLTTLFDTVRLRTETAGALAKLQRMQLPDGAFPWFEKMPDDRYLTQLIVAGFGKLKKLGALDASHAAAARPVLQAALAYLDAATARDYADLRRQKAVKLADNHLGDLQIQALYARSFWPGQPVAKAAAPAYAYYRGQAAKYWTGQTRYLQAQAALALFRESKGAPSAQQILRALAENALHSPALGMYWKDVTGGYYWREAPTETQATLIEAFDEVKNDQKSVDEMKLWLLTQKQAHNWPSTRATADACYALLLRGSDWLAAPQPLQISVGAQAVRPEVAQAGTGYFKTSWPAAEIQPAQGKVTVAKPDAGLAWGALYWQYFEDIDKITPAATPLSLERQLYRETRTAGGPVLEKLTAATPLKVGDALVVRLVMRTDRALEYVHLKDQRAAGLEPIGQTSGYRYQNGLGYYESPRDAATNFFLSEVPRGTHVFEYRLRASQAGDFSGGLSQVQCLYAPNSGPIRLGSASLSCGRGGAARAPKWGQTGRPPGQVGPRRHLHLAKTGLSFAFRPIG